MGEGAWVVGHPEVSQQPWPLPPDSIPRDSSTPAQQTNAKLELAAWPLGEIRSIVTTQAPGQRKLWA